MIVTAALLVGLLAYGVASKGRDTSIDQAIADGKRIAAPDATLPVLGESGTASISSFKGKVVVLNFWGSWCPPCVEELPVIEAYHRSITPKGGTVLGINMRETSDAALEYVRRFDLTYPNLRDRDGDYAERYDSRAFPETFVIDREGQIAAKRRGPVDEAWLRRERRPAAGGGRMRAFALAALLLFALAAAAPRASLPDIEDEVMCMQCGTALNISTSRRGRQAARLHPQTDRRGQDQGRRSRTRWSTSSARACWRCPRATASTSPSTWSRRLRCCSRSPASSCCCGDGAASRRSLNRLAPNSIQAMRHALERDLAAYDL